MKRSDILSAVLLACQALLIDSAPIDSGNEKRQLSGAYDYVIVGGGTAGLVMAERLSEDPNIKVAVIEAGTYYQISNPILSSTPAGDSFFAGASPTDTNPLVDWNIVTAPQAGANGRRVHYARGKCLGGSSARNFMIYQRGSAQSYQKWADAIGDNSYNWENFQPYFKKSVAFRTPSSSRAPNATAEYNPAAFNANGGPLEVGYPNYAQPFASWLQPSLNEIGIPTVQDFNSGQLMGCQYAATTINSNMKRETSETSFLKIAAGRPNLTVIQLALAKKVLFDGNRRATGVVYQIGPLAFTAKAAREVIVSAGAFQSPQLLMVSGIGPAATLNRFNIPIIADRRGVGQGMQDHVFFGPSWRVKVSTLTRIANDPLYVAAQFAGPYSISKQGPLTSDGCDFLGWEKQAAADLSSQFPADWPELEYISGPGYIGDFSSIVAGQPRDGYQYATLLGALVAPLSRGSVTLASADTADLPVVDPNWLTHPTDVAVAVAAYKRMRAAFAARAMQGVLADSVEYYPGPQVQSDAEILATIRKDVMTVWHASCTCRMGKVDDPDAVVDSNARVIGVTGLRVVDASSFALLPPGHPQSTVYALAEKIAAQIRAGY
ncbi:choline dehydrogenase [Apiospora phragmitis]|uniref:Choline dehydrogenase n=1 Tax=Apiospora phragmitis TaxID=2905665 RepID=A0ABR1URP5_9PEZI